MILEIAASPFLLIKNIGKKLLIKIVQILGFIEVFDISMYQIAHENNKKYFPLTASREDWTLDPWFTRPVLYHWAIEADYTK